MARFTCADDYPVAVSASHTLLAVAYATHARLQLFAAVSRRSLFFDRLPIPHGTGARKEPPASAASVIRLSEHGDLLAWCDSAGRLSVFALTGAIATGRAADVTHLLHRWLPAPGAALAWHCSTAGTPRLASGDAKGEVRLWQMGDASNPAGSGRILLQGEGSAIVQLECGGRGLGDSGYNGPVLAASTHARTTLLPLPTNDFAAQDLDPPRVVGKAKREGAYGACFLNADLDVCPSARLVASRPGRRLWLVDAGGAVLSTLKFDVSSGCGGGSRNDGGSSGRGGDSSSSGAAGSVSGLGPVGRLCAVAGLSLLVAWGEAPPTAASTRTPCESSCGIDRGGSSPDGSAHGGVTANGSAGATPPAAGDGCICLMDPNAVRVLDTVVVAPPVHSVACVALTAARGEAKSSSSAPPSHRPAAPGGSPRLLEILVVHGDAPRRMQTLFLHGIPPEEDKQAAPSAGRGSEDLATRPAEASAPSAVGSQGAHAMPPSTDRRLSTELLSPDPQEAGFVASDPWEASPPLAEKRATATVALRRKPSIVRTISHGRGISGRRRVTSGSDASAPGSGGITSSSSNGSRNISQDTTPALAPLGRRSAATLAPGGDPGGASDAAALSWTEGVALALADGASLASTAAPAESRWMHTKASAARGVLALLFLGWRTGWRDGALQRQLTRVTGHVALEAWAALLSAARHADGSGRSSPSAERGMHETRGLRDAPPTDGPPCATLLMLRAMLVAQPPSVCLGVLRRQPRLADGLPPEGYLELLQAVRREAGG